MTWRWVDKQALLLLHDESLAEHGGASGLRDEGLLDPALARLQNRAVCESPNVAALAASYGVGVANSHAFIDGNKRVAFLSVGLFLAINGWRLNATQLEATSAMLAVAAGELDEAAFAEWLRQHITAR